MLKDITLGQYFPGDSFVHKLDPRVKIHGLAIFLIAIFTVKDLYMYIPLAFVLWLIMYNSKVPVRLILNGIKSLRFIIILTFVINIFATPGEIIFKFWIFNITREGIRFALFMALRLIFLVTSSSLLTLTTSPIALTDGLEKIMKPLSKLGFPSHQLAMMMTIALRFIPTLFDEATKIMKSQTARGADFESGNIFKRAKNLVPLFINSFRRADELAIAMEARCYHGGEGRTRLNELSYEKRDYITIILMLLFLGVYILHRVLL
ncbi:MAG: energy-coupling factor transporter transmembrane component T [Lagierella massiliensis]|nr:energy-coupling factor transporter transmembrane component T [Lagierella massiliensis]